MKYVLINHPGDGEWIMQRAEGVFNDKLDQVIAVHRDGQIAGGVVYQLYLGGSICLMMAGSEDNWATPTFLWSVFHYAFVQLGVRKVLGIVRSTNERSIRVCYKLGFRLEGRLAEMYPDGADLLLMTMTRDHCKWLRFTPKHYRRNLREAA